MQFVAITLDLVLTDVFLYLLIYLLLCMYLVFVVYSFRAINCSVSVYCLAFVAAVSSACLIRLSGASNTGSFSSISLITEFFWNSGSWVSLSLSLIHI